jgi:hypothetical protein
MTTCRIRGLALLLAILLPLAAAGTPRRPAGIAPVCAAGQRPCSGPYGQQCYTPSDGQRCSGGLVCGAGQQACSGAFGASCYAPASGQQCRQGVVCQTGQSVCTAGGLPHCYRPELGESCQ